LVIKLADRLDNCSDFSVAPQKFKEKYTKETKEILSKLTERELTNTHKNLILEIEKKLN
jgi:(p)ppGpp synthase/HD superfamily hydrolase